MKRKKSMLYIAAAAAVVCILMAIYFFMDHKDIKNDQPSPNQKNSGDTGKPAPNPAHEDNKGPSCEIVVPQKTPLTSAQTAEVNAAFDPVFLDDMGNIISANPINSFFTSWYDIPEDIDIYAFLKYYPKDSDVTDEEEFEALKNAVNCPFDQNDTLDSVPFPIHKYSSETINEALQKYAGITIDELNGVGMDKICYLPENDTYYTFTSDFAPGIFFCTGGEIEGDTVRLYSKSDDGSRAILKLKKKDGRYLIVSHKQAAP